MFHYQIQYHITTFNVNNRAEMEPNVLVCTVVQLIISGDISVETLQYQPTTTLKQNPLVWILLISDPKPRWVK